MLVSGKIEITFLMGIMGTRILLSALLMIFGAIGLYVAYSFNIHSLVQSVGIELYGALVVGLVTWLLTKTPIELVDARDLRRNHFQLFQLVISGPKSLTIDMIESFIARVNETSARYKSQKKRREAFEGYRDDLETFKAYFDKEKPKNRSPTYREKWNPTADSFGELLKVLNRKAFKAYTKEAELFKMSEAHIDPDSIPNETPAFSIHTD